MRKSVTCCPCTISQTAIEILPGVKLSKPKMYSMTPRELRELRDYIDKNVVRGFIQVAKS